jgi:hypothetical protein
MIFYLKKCKFLISNDSGMVDFAKNCGCKKILIIRNLTVYHHYFKPFNNETIFINCIKDIEKYCV